MSEIYFSDDEREAEIRDGLSRAHSTLFARGDVKFLLSRLDEARAALVRVATASTDTAIQSIDIDAWLRERSRHQVQHDWIGALRDLGNWVQFSPNPRP